MKTEPAILDLYQTVRTMINDLKKLTISEDREEEIHEFYARYSNMDSKYLLENCVTCPIFDDPPLYAFKDAMLTLEIAYQRFEAIGTIQDSK
jgi:hypothetical protein